MYTGSLCMKYVGPGCGEKPKYGNIFSCAFHLLDSDIVPFGNRNLVGGSISFEDRCYKSCTAVFFLDVVVSIVTRSPADATESLGDTFQLQDY